MRTVFRVIVYLKRYPLLAVAQMACAVLMTVLVIVFPSVAQSITGEVIPQRDFDRSCPSPSSRWAPFSRPTCSTRCASSSTIRSSRR